MIATAKVGKEFLVNTTWEESQFNPSIAQLDNGNFVVVWDDPSAGGLKAQIHAADGSQVGGELSVNTSRVDNLSSTSVAAMTGGGFVVSWTRSEGTLPNGTVSSQTHAQIFASIGSKSGGEFDIGSGNPPFGSESRIVGLATGGFVAAWSDSNGAGGFDVKAEIHAADGSRIGDAFVVNTSTAGSQRSPEISALAGGGFVVGWSDTGSLQSLGLKVQVFAEDGSRIGGEVPLARDNFGGLTVAGIANGGFVASWVGTDKDIHAQIFDGRGNKLGTGFLVNSHTPGYQLHPSIAALSNADFVITWQDGDEVTPGSGTLGDSSGAAVKAQIFSPDGAKVGDEFLVNTNVQGDQVGPSIVGTKAGGFIVAWQDDHAPEDVGGSSIKAQMFATYDHLAITSGRGSVSTTIDVPEGTIRVGTVTAVDPAAAGPLHFAISGGDDASLFRIDSATGILSFKSAPDFEAPADRGTDNVYDVRVTVSNGVETASQNMAVAVSDVAEAFPSPGFVDRERAYPDANGVIHGDGGPVDRMAGGAGGDRLEGRGGFNQYYGARGDDTFILNADFIGNAHLGASRNFEDQYAFITDFNGAQSAGGTGEHDFIALSNFGVGSHIDLVRESKSGTINAPAAVLYYYTVTDGITGAVHNIEVNSVNGKALGAGDFAFY